MRVYKPERRAGVLLNMEGCIFLNDVKAAWNGKYIISWDSVLVGKLEITGSLSQRGYSCEKPPKEFMSEVDRTFFTLAEQNTF
jgi:hypothetical protein